jgi:hypothetical protein
MKKNQYLLFVFSIFTCYSQTPLHNFSFDGTLINTNKTATFYGPAKYVTDRTGNTKGAQRLVNEALETNLGNLPQGSSPRTISIWIKFNQKSDANYIWGYGSAVNTQYCGLLHQGTNTTLSNLNVAGWGPTNDLITPINLTENTWYNYTFTYDGNVSNLYRNGVLLKTYNGPKRNNIGSVFRIGKVNTLTSINADIDDLKIYDIVLTPEQIVSIYNSSPVLVSNEEINTTEIITNKGKLAKKKNQKIAYKQ